MWLKKESDLKIGEWSSKSRRVKTKNKEKKRVKKKRKVSICEKTKERK